MQFQGRIESHLDVMTQKCLNTSHFHREVQNELYVFASSVLPEFMILAKPDVLSADPAFVNIITCRKYVQHCSTLTLHFSALLQGNSVFSNVGNMHQGHNVIP